MPPMMHRPKTAPPLLLAALALASAAYAQPRALTDAESARIERLISSMTLEEKLGQLTLVSSGFTNPTDKREWTPEVFDEEVRTGRLGAIYGHHDPARIDGLQKIAVEQSRLKIPLIFGNDVIHGYKTTFPTPLAEACSWDLRLIEQAAEIAAREARAGGTRWTFAPMVDICRDPRWGRVIEGAGEDPFLGSKIAAARVRGFQGADPGGPSRLLACAKHYVAYGGAEGGRDYNTVDVSERTLRSVYLPPFRSAVDAGVGSLMSAFNEIGGVPATAHRQALSDILRGEWGFRGMVVSDYDSVGELQPHGVAASLEHAARLAVAAGVDMDMCSMAYRALKGEVEAGRVEAAVVDEAVRRVLRAKTWAGVFETPMTESPQDPNAPPPAEHADAARRMAAHSIVLLKNEGGLLPISPSAKRIAVIGPLAADDKSPFGAWSSIGARGKAVTVLEAIEHWADGKVEVEHVAGCAVESTEGADLDAAAKAAVGSDLAIVVLGEDLHMSGEAHSRISIDLPGMQEDLLKAVCAAGKPTVLVLLTGRPLSIRWAAKNAPAIVLAWHPGQESGRAVVDVLTGAHNPSGRLAISIPQGAGQIPVYYAAKNTGRPFEEKDGYTTRYLDSPNAPLYPFGFGLSYTAFDYANMEVSPPKVAADGQVTVSVDVRNRGQRAGHEVVQVYVRDVVASVTRPVKELRGFEKIWLEPGETKRVSIALPVAELGVYDLDMRYVVEPGEFRVWAGPDSTRGIEGRFEVTAAGSAAAR